MPFSNPILFINFSIPVTDDVRDAVFQTAYVMLKDYERRKRIRSKICEGFVDRKGPMSYNGFNGIGFDTQVDTEKGILAASFIIRPKDMDGIEDAEDYAWVDDHEANDEEAFERNRRPNPIRQIAKRIVHN